MLGYDYLRQGARMISGLAGVIIWSESIDKLVNFYHNVLDFPIHSVRSNFVAFSFGDVRLSIGQHSGIQGFAKAPNRIMLNLATDNIQSTYAHLCERGVPFLRMPEREHGGHWIATFSDPDGNVLQLLQQPNQNGQ